jgi:hypothetical protein
LGTEIAAILHDLQRLRNAVQDGRFPVKLLPDRIGARSHGFRPNPPLSEETVRAFEERHAVRLPVDYREFLICVGDGGAGPPCGVFKLGEYEGEPWAERDGFIGVISKPFPHSEPWNDLSGVPAWDEAWPGDPNWEEAEYERVRDEWQAWYWDTTRMNGSVPINHQGCNHRLWLVVTGAEAGNVWCDERADQSGLFPLRMPGRERVTFLAWYRSWVDEALTLVELQRE